MKVPGGASGNSRTPTTLAEINVTPFVDVMLVLLIVFMVSAPLMQQGVQVDLPKADAGTLDEVPEQVVLVIKDQKTLLFNGKELEKGTLRQRLTALAEVDPNIQVVVQANHKVPYGVIAHVIAEVKKARVHRVGLATSPGQSQYQL